MNLMDQMTKMTMDSERIKYMDYLRALIALNGSGYKCTNEIKVTLEKIHGMLFSEEEVS